MTKMLQSTSLHIVIRLQSFTHTSVSDFMSQKACVKNVTSDEHVAQTFSNYLFTTI